MPDAATAESPNPAPSGVSSSNRAVPAPTHELLFESNYVDVLGSKMHYLDVGQGEPIVFLHGNPTSSYIWRNIIPHVQGQARCIAPDLIGMGKSDHPDIPYRFDDHYRYLCAFIDALDLGPNITLVIHDWGSALGFRWAMDHSDRVRAVCFMEAVTRPMTLADMPGSLGVAFRLMRSPVGFLLISVGNLIVNRMLPDLTFAPMSPEVHGHYKSAFPTVASRKAVRQWPREVPFDGSPADNHAVFEAYRAWLAQTDVPKLLFYGNDGVAIKEAEVAWCRETLSNLEMVDLGDAKHFVQETHPTLIGSELARWYASL